MAHLELQEMHMLYNNILVLKKYYSSAFYGQRSAAQIHYYGLKSIAQFAICPGTFAEMLAFYRTTLCIVARYAYSYVLKALI